MARTSIYKSITGVEYTFYVKAKGRDVCVSFSSPGATLKTNNIDVAKAIERSSHFKDGRITNITERVTKSTIKDASTLNEGSKDADNSDKGEGQPNPAPSATADDHRYPDVKNLSDAVEILTTKYHVAEEDIPLKKDVLAKAKELNVKFPNYR